MQRIYFLVIVTVITSALIMGTACLSTGAEAPSPFAIAWNYDTSGYLETCGCSAHQLGGMARRATQLAKLREIQPVLAIEGAHVVDDTGEFQLFKAETIVRALNEMDYSAMMLGFREAQHGEDGLNRLSELARFPCFSANLVTSSGPWKTSTVLTTVAGVKVGITGVSQPEAINFEIPEGIEFSDPSAALDEVLAGLNARSDLVIVCLEGERSWISSLAKTCDTSVDLFLTGDRSKVTADIDFHGQPALLNNWRLGKYLGLVTVDPLPDGGFNFAGTTIALEDTIADDEAILNLLDTEYRSQLKDRFFSQMKVDLEQLYLPPETCEPCHREAYDSYKNSRHSHALQTLVEHNQTYNPDCMSCHVVYDPDMDELQSMNCIVCHSNITEQHLWDAVDENVQRPETPPATYTYDFCVQCHDELNDLAYEDYWPQYMYELYHGGDLSEARSAAIDMGLDSRIGDLYPDQAE